MASLASIFISVRQLRALGWATWMLSFLVFLAVLAALGHHRLQRAIDADLAAGLAPLARLDANLGSTFAALGREVTGEPCGEAFHRQLRRVAYLPDGFNEFFLAPGGIVHCSASVRRFDEPVALGAPDFRAGADGATAFWVDRDLSFAGLHGERGAIALRDPFAIVIPAQELELRLPPWIDAEAVMVAPDGRWWHRGGVAGAYQEVRIAEAAGGVLPYSSGRSHSALCVPGGLHCVAAVTGLDAIVERNAGPVAVLVLLAVFLAGGTTRLARRAVERVWSFEARFRRNLDLDSVVCAYQPLLDLRSGEITGCEVLARWRDLDDAIVYPDRFLPVVEKAGLTRKLTRLVVARAASELAAHVPAGRRLQVNVNVFPRDLEAAVLLPLLEPLSSLRDRFDTVLEIVESDAIPPGCAGAEIDALHRAGFKVYIDDFGAGYSNLAALARWSVDGVKLDRCFAMAPRDSLMGSMLGHAVDMIQAAGRVVVVEGVETAERLGELRRDRRRIDYVQGYHIGRPLDAAGFARLLPGQAPQAARGRAA